MKKLSIVVPVYNSKAILPLLLEAIDSEKTKHKWDLELILIDDGSKDLSFQEIKRLSKIYTYIKGVQLARNFGHQIAVRTGLKFCTKELIAVIDDDLQDPPVLIQTFIQKISEGFDVVYGVRKKRKEHYFKKISYHLFYRILNQLSSIEIPLDTGDFCVMKKEVVDNILKFEERNVFLRGIRAWVGFKQIGIEYERNSRNIGESGYSLRKLFSIALDGIFSFSKVPLRLITISGYIGLIAALCYTFWISYLFLLNNIPVKGFTTITILISFFSSLILICLGVIGEYISRIYDEVRKRPHSVISEIIFEHE